MEADVDDSDPGILRSRQRLERMAECRDELIMLMKEDPAAAGRLGGRRRVQDRTQLRGVEGGSLSNRRQPGQKRKYNSVTAKDGLAMLKFMREARDKFSDERDYWRAMVKRYDPRTKRDLET